ncbi:MAG: hypothetical protein H0X30_06405 [Anaerolineae bacterium]|nr:hypothetical protein [Anaerolineae bacterium]
MSWVSKEHELPFEHTPIEGLYFLCGDAYSRVVERDTTVGMKYPKINFPSGRAYEVFDRENNEIWVHLFGEYAVPLFADRDRAFAHLQALITPTDHIAYFIHPVDDDSVLIWGNNELERLLITYDRSNKVIINIQGVSGTIGAYRVRGHTYHLP